MHVVAGPSNNGHPHTFSVSSFSVCIGDTLTVQDTCVHDAFQPTTRIWSFSQGARPSIINNQIQAKVCFNIPGVKVITLSVYDIFNVAYTDTVQITVRGSLADAGSTKKYCDNTSGILIGTADTTTANIVWTNSANLILGGTRVISVAPAASSYYFLTVTKNGCQTMDSVWVQRVVAPTVSLGNNASVCNGIPVQIGTTAQANLIYNWFPGKNLSDSTVSQPFASPSLNTVYTLFATDTNGCSSNAQTTVNVVNNLYALPGTNQSICLGDTIKIGPAQKSGWNYQWTPSFGLNVNTLAQPIAFPNTTTTYKLVVSFNGCSDSNNILIIVKPLPVVDLQGRHLFRTCFNDSILIGGNTIPGYHYNWSPNYNLSSQFNASTTVHPNNDTWYTLHVLGTNACTNKDSLLIDIFDSIKAYAGLDQSICLGNSIILGAQLQVASGGSGNYNYSWLPTNSLNASSFPHPIAQPTTTTTYILSVNDAYNSKCGQAFDTVTITIFPLPSFQLPFKKMFCRGEVAVQLTGIPNGGQFSIVKNSSSTPLVNNILDPNDTSLHIGTPYVIRYQYTSPQGCTYDTSVSILIKAKPIAIAGPDINYCAASGHYNNQLLGFGTGTAHWLPNNYLNNDSIFNPIVTTLQSNYFVLQIENGACIAQDTMYFNVCKDTVYLIANYDKLTTTINKSDSIIIEGNDSSSINKYDHSIYLLQTAPKHGIGLIDQLVNKIIFHYSPNKDFVGYDTAVYILKDTFDLRVYSDTALILIKVSPKTNPDHFLSGTDKFNCADTLLRISLNDEFSPSTPIQISLLEPLSTKMSIKVEGQYLSFHPIEKVFIDSFRYVLVQNGLSDTATVIIDFNCPTCHCQIPEGFSPNNDGKNDYLELLNTENCIPDCALIIYNRWGNVVFRTDHYDTKWDGKYNGVDLPDGTYFYIINSAEQTSGGKSTGYLILQR
jgi:gliding motility-associated-like protein